jgi:hypothetical protein
MVFSDLISKSVVTVFWLSLKTKVMEGLPVWASKLSMLRVIDCATKPTEGCNDVGHVSRSNCLLCVEASLDRVS